MFASFGSCLPALSCLAFCQSGPFENEMWVSRASHPTQPPHSARASARMMLQSHWRRSSVSCRTVGHVHRAMPFRMQSRSLRFKCSLERAWLARVRVMKQLSQNSKFVRAFLLIDICLSSFPLHVCHLWQEGGCGVCSGCNPPSPTISLASAASSALVPVAPTTSERIVSLPCRQLSQGGAGACDRTWDHVFACVDVCPIV